MLKPGEYIDDPPNPKWDTPTNMEFISRQAHEIAVMMHREMIDAMGRMERHLADERVRKWEGLWLL